MDGAFFFAMGRQCHLVRIVSYILWHAYTAFSMLAFFAGEGKWMCLAFFPFSIALFVKADWSHGILQSLNVDPRD